MQTTTSAAAAPVDPAFRIINTGNAITGPFGTRYVHDAARPFAVLFSGKHGEICALRCATEQAAKAAVARFTEARSSYAARQVEA